MFFHRGDHFGITILSARPCISIQIQYRKRGSLAQQGWIHNIILLISNYS